MLRVYVGNHVFDTPRPPIDEPQQARQYIRQGILEDRARAPEITEEQREDEWRAMMRFLEPDFGDQDDDDEALKRWWEEREEEYTESRADLELLAATTESAQAPSDELQRLRALAIQETQEELGVFLESMQLVSEMEEVAGPKVPSRPADRRRWESIWRVIKSWVYQGYSPKEIAKRLAAKRPHLKCHPDTISSIIDAGDAGLLD
jgi:hypothetical protein